MTRASDAQLLEDSLRDVERFGEIFDRHAQAIFRFIARRIGTDEAGDLLADVFLAAFEARARYDHRHASALPWLYGISSNLLSKHFRRRAAEDRRTARTRGRDQPTDHADSVTDSVDAAARMRSIAEMIDGLPAGERDTLLLHAWEDLTYDEIADALGIPVGTVRSRLNRARRRLRAASDEIDRVRRARPDLLVPLADATPSVLDRERDRLMQAVEGKTKIVEDAGNGEVLIRSKDDITAADGARRDVVAGKAAASTRTTCNIFRLLERSGIATHFVDQVDDVTFRARNVRMIPLELVARRYATGSFRDRFPELAEGAVFDEVVFEVFEKDDANHDPLVQLDFDAGVLRRFVPNTRAAEAIGPEVRAGDLVSEEPLQSSRYADLTPELFAELRSRTIRTFEVVERAWREHGAVYIDCKIECGIDRGTGELLVADVIDSDSGRLRFGDVDMSKQAYRDGSATLPEIKKRFDEVAALTDTFV